MVDKLVNDGTSIVDGQLVVKSGSVMVYHGFIMMVKNGAHVALVVLKGNDSIGSVW